MEGALYLSLHLHLLDNANLGTDFSCFLHLLDIAVDSFA
jgi:hypothetical protein